MTNTWNLHFSNPRSECLTSALGADADSLTTEVPLQNPSFTSQICVAAKYWFWYRKKISVDYAKHWLWEGSLLQKVNATTIVPPFIPLTITHETAATKVHTLVLGWCSGAWRYRKGLHLQAGVLSSSNLAPHFERNLLDIFPQVGIYSWAGAPWDTFR